MTKQHELSVEPEIILQYLLNRCDLNRHRRLRVDDPFKFLGYVALYPYKDLLEEYRKIDFNHWNALETLDSYKRLFTAASERCFPEMIDYPVIDKFTASVNPIVCKVFLIAAADEGEAMLVSSDHQFLSVFLMLCFLGLGFDTNTQEDFEKMIASEADTEAKLRSALRAITQALTVIDT